MLKPGNVRSAMIPDIGQLRTSGSEDIPAGAFPPEAGPTMNRM